MRIESEEVATADKRLDDFVVSAERAERAADSLTGGSKRASSGLIELVKSIQKDVAEMNALAKASDGVGVSFSRTSRQVKAHNDNMKLATHEMTNLGRNFADVGVMLASGQNPFMTLLQQGPQIADVFHTASLRGLGFKAVLAEIIGMAAPFVAVLAPIAVVAGAIGGAFAISAQQINKDNKGLIDSLHLTKEQLEDVKNKTVTMGDVMKGTWNAAAGALTKAFAPEIKATGKFLGDLYEGAIDWAVRSVKTQIGTWVGGFEAVRATWQMLPAVLGDVAYSTASVVIRAVEASVNAAITLINGLVDRANGVTANLGLPQLGRLDSISLAGLQNPYAGAAAKAGEAAGKAFADGAKRGAGYVDTAMAAIESETLKAYRARVLKEAGKADKVAKDTAKELALKAAIADGRFATGPANDRGVNSIDVKTVADFQKSLFVSKGGLHDFDKSGIETSLQTAKGASKQLAEFEEGQRRARVEAERRMWDDLTGLQYSGNKKLAAIGKAAAIAQATMDTYAAATASYKALAGIPIIGPVLGAAAAAAAIAAGVANIGHIAGVKGFRDGGWTGNGATDRISGVTHGQEFVVKAGPAAENRAVLEAMNAGRPLPPPARPSQPAANDRGRVIQVHITGDNLWKAQVSEIADGVARPIADQASEGAATRAVATTADQYTRIKTKKLY
jgi:hypothetical protein